MQPPREAKKAPETTNSADGEKTETGKPDDTKTSKQNEKSPFPDPQKMNDPRYKVFRSCYWYTVFGMSYKIDCAES
jgi:hypothetical protein